MKYLIAVVGLLCGFSALAVAESSYRNAIKGTGARNGTVEFNFVEPSEGAAMNLVPGGDNANGLGTSALRFKSIYGAQFVIGSNAAPRTNVTPVSAGVLIFNSAGVELCMSTGTTVSTWVKVATPTVACAN
jgi:hypothetical protein